MSSKKVTIWISSDWLFVLVSLLTLVTFVVAQSVYEVLAANQAFLSVRGVSNMQLLGIIAVFNLLPALVLFLFWALIRKLHRDLARAFLSIVYFLFFLAFFLQIQNAYLSEWHPFPHSYLLWIGPASLLLFASLHFEKPFRSFLLALSPAVLIFPVLFLTRTWTSPRDFLPPESLTARRIVSQTEKENLPPIFLLVFDEFTTHALLDDNGQIDGERFPNFKKLAGESYWFRNATANSENSIRSIPVILTGNYHHGDDPSFEAYPNNLFALLYPYYDIYVHEVGITHFCVPRLFYCSGAEIRPSNIQLLKDTSYLYAARVAPQNVNIGLPDLTRTWGPFKDAQGWITTALKYSERFIDSLSLVNEQNVFYFSHHMLPHSPYALTSDGKIYNTPPFRFLEEFAGNRSLLKELRDRYLMQVAYVDREIGQFIDRLKKLDLYDQSLVIITADHGISWKPEAPGRTLTRNNAGMILSVPLFIKTPFQDSGVISDRDVQHIDLVSSVVDLLGLQVPWKVAGRSAFDTDAPPRLKVAYNVRNMRFEFPETLGLARVAVRLDAELDVQTSPLVGEKTELFDIGTYDTIQGFLDIMGASPVPLHPDSEQYPIHVAGWAVVLDKSSVPNQIAVAVNGEIVAVTSLCCRRDDIAKHFNNPEFLQSGWFTSFSSRKLKEGQNTAKAYVVLDARRRKLAALKATRKNVLYKTGTEFSERSLLIGKPVEAFDIQKYATIRGYLDAVSESHLRIESPSREIRVYATGWAVLLDKEVIPDQIAVALNGEIVAVTSPCCDRPDVAAHYRNPKFLQSGWVATFSSRKLRDGMNNITAYVVLDAKAKKLALLNTKNNTIQLSSK